MKVSDLLLMAVAYLASISAAEAAAFVSTTYGGIVSSSRQAPASAVLVQQSRVAKRTSYAADGRKRGTQQNSLTALQLSPSDMLNSASNFWIATIDADIDSIPTNEFGTVFAGGIVVMLGGVLAALMVGFILERGDLYANVVADSYAQGAEDEEFWKGLSEEEKKKTQEILQKIKDSKQGGSKQSEAPLVQPVQDVATSTDEPSPKAADTPTSNQSKQVDMFSDYD